MNQNELKKEVAKAAVEHIENNIVLGVGSGSTVLCFVEALKNAGMQFKYIVAASEQTTKTLQEAGFQVSDLNSSDEVDVYVDGADEINPDKVMIKGGGAALTREKIIAASAKKFICIVDESKKVSVLGKFPLPVEVIPMARSYVAREMVKLGGDPVWRKDVVTDNGNWILDVHNLSIHDPATLENKINNIAGVVTVGIFSQQSADIVLMSQKNGSISQW